MRVNIIISDNESTVLERFAVEVEKGTLLSAGLPDSELAAALFVQRSLENNPWIDVLDD